MTLYDVLRAFVRGDRELTDPAFTDEALAAIDAHEAASQPAPSPPPQPVVAKEGP